MQLKKSITTPISRSIIVILTSIRTITPIITVFLTTSGYIHTNNTTQFPT